MIKAYWVLIKPRQTLLLAYVGMCSMLAASPHVNPSEALMVLAALITSIAGATALTNYIDRDIDAKMLRTRNRPLPRGDVSPSNALRFSAILIIASLVLALRIGAMFTLFLLIGVINSAVIYNLLTKRRTALNILIASPTGAMPILGGWSAVGPLSIEPILMGSLIIVWIPVHVWSVALRWRSDYSKASIPMLPLLTNGPKLLACSSFILAAYSFLVVFLKLINYHPISIPILTMLNALLLGLSVNLAVRPTERNSLMLFKFTSPYIFAIFTLWPLSALLASSG